MWCSRCGHVGVSLSLQCGLGCGGSCRPPDGAWEEVEGLELEEQVVIKLVEAVRGCSYIM